MWEWMCRSTYSLLRCRMEVRGQFYASTALRWVEIAPVTHWIGVWVGSRASLHDVERRKLLPLKGLEFKSFWRPVRQQSSDRLRYPGFHFFVAKLRRLLFLPINPLRYVTGTLKNTTKTKKNVSPGSRNLEHSRYIIYYFISAYLYNLIRSTTFSWVIRSVNLKHKIRLNNIWKSTNWISVTKSRQWILIRQIITLHCGNLSRLLQF
jgi:hypothetical protein